MSTSEKTRQDLLSEIAELRARLAEAEQTLEAIRTGEVDAVMVSGPEGEQVYTLKGADYAYRRLIEEMNDGAATLTPDGTILYCNRRLAEMLRTPLEDAIGSRVQRFARPDQAEMLGAFLQQGQQRASRAEFAVEAAIAFLDKPLDVEQVVKLIGEVRETAILVVEDDEKTAGALSGELRQQGY